MRLYLTGFYELRNRPESRKNSPKHGGENNAALQFTTFALTKTRRLGRLLRTFSGKYLVQITFSRQCGGMLCAERLLAEGQRALNRWRHNHKCTAEEISFGQPVRLAAPGGSTPPQKTWTGNCAAPVTYMVRAIRLKRAVVELHVDRTRSSRSMLEPAFTSLLGRVRLSAE